MDSPAGGCASDVPRTRPCTHRLDVFNMVSIRKMYDRIGRKKVSRHSQESGKWSTSRVPSEIPSDTCIPVHKHAQHAKSKRVCRDRHISVRLGGFRLSVTCDSLPMDRLLIYNPLGTPDLYLGYALWELLV